MSSRLLRLPYCAVMRGSVARIALVLALGCGVMASSALWVSTASASVPRRTQLRHEARSIMNETYSQFILTKTYDRYPPFNWSSDGCSIPGRHLPNWVGAVVRSVANLFNKPCQLHDFGYRNYGKGLRLSPTEKTRHWIDNRFYTEMKRECNDKYDDWWHKLDGQYEACNGEASLMYKAVRTFGHF